MSETTRKLLPCQCPGTRLPGFYDNPPCPDDVSQEDGLCDHCRRMDCPTITTPAELDRRQLADMQRRGLELRDAF